jgi:hypothetical protein
MEGEESSWSSLVEKRRWRRGGRQVRLEKEKNIGEVEAEAAA